MRPKLRGPLAYTAMARTTAIPMITTTPARTTTARITPRWLPPSGGIHPCGS